MGFRVHAFDAHGPNLDLLDASRALNGAGFTSLLKLHRAVLSDTRGEHVDFGVHDTNKGACTVINRNDFIANANGGDNADLLLPYTLEPRVTATLDDFYSPTGGSGPYNAHEPRQRIELMKINVEGYECKVLNGARETIKQRRPRFILTRWERKLSSPPACSLKMMADFLFDLGYVAHHTNFACSRGSAIDRNARNWEENFPSNLLFVDGNRLPY